MSLRSLVKARGPLPGLTSVVSVPSGISMGVPVEINELMKLFEESERRTQMAARDSSLEI